jgi:hypothetical protein
MTEKVKETLPCICGGVMETCGDGWYCKDPECGYNFAPAPKQERLVKECLACGEKFHPLDENDKTCKSCLRKLFIEIIVKMQQDVSELKSAVPYKLNSMDEVLRRYHELADRRYK